MTYAELVAAITSGLLNKGESITISDFKTVNYLLNGNTVLTDINTGATEALMVTASSSNTLEKEAKSVAFPNDLIYYDWNPANWLSDLSFSTDGTNIITGWKGVIYYRKDTRYNVVTNYDWRNVRLRRWKLDPATWVVGTTYAQYAIVKGSNGKVYYSIGAGNVGNDPTTNEFTLWRPLIDADITDKYLSWTATNLAITHWVTGESASTFNVPCSADYFDFLTFGEAALSAQNFNIVIGGRDQNAYGNRRTIINNLLLNISSRTQTFSEVNFVGFAFNSTIEAAGFYFNDFGRYFHTNLMLGVVDNLFDLHSPNGGFFRNVIVDFKKIRTLVDFNDNIVGKMSTCHFNQYVNNNYFGRDFNYNEVSQYHLKNIHGPNITKCSFGPYFEKNSIKYGKVTACRFGNNVNSNTFLSNPGSGNAMQYCTFGNNFYNNSITGTCFNVRTGEYVFNNVWPNMIQDCYIGSFTNNVTFRNSALIKVTFTDGWKAYQTALDLSACTLLHGSDYTKIVTASGSGTAADRYMLEYINASLVKTLANLTTNTVIKEYT